MKRKTLYRGLSLIVGLVLLFSLTSTSWAEGWPYPQVTLQNDWFGISYLGMTDNGDGTSTWYYQVDELGSGKGFKDLSNWMIELPDCAPVVDATPEPWEYVHSDPNHHLQGVKWETGNGFESGVFSVTVEGVWNEGSVQVGTKAGRYTDLAWITGLSCEDYGDGGQPPDGDEGPPPGEGDGSEGGGEEGPSTPPPPEDEYDPCWDVEEGNICQIPPEELW